MLTACEEILRGNVIEWRKDAPAQAMAGEAVNVCVTVLEEPVNKIGRGKRMAEALKKIAESGAIAGV